MRYPRPYDLISSSLTALVLAAGCKSEAPSGNDDPPGGTARFVVVSRDPFASARTATIVAIRVDGITTSTAVHYTVNDTSRLRIHIDGGENLADSVVLQTNSGRRADVAIRFGQLRGRAVLYFRAPALGISDSLVYPLENSVSELTVFPEDTALYVGQKYTLVYQAWSQTAQRPAFVTPVFSTDRPDVVEFDAIGQVVAKGVGRARVIVTDGIDAIKDTILLSVVPHGRVAATTEGGVLLFNLDGTGRRLLRPDPARQWTFAHMRWAASGGELVARIGRFGEPGERETIRRIDTLAPVPEPVRLVEVGGAGQPTSASQPAPSADGQWIYYTASFDTDRGEIWRVRTDGTSAVRFGPPTPDFNLDFSPAPSPIDERLAFTTDRTPNQDAVLRILHPSTGTIDSIDVPANGIRWSPDGQWIAYLTGGDASTFRMIRPDGTGDRALSAELCNTGFDWSPDSKYIIITCVGRTSIIDVATVEKMPLPAYTAGFMNWSWSKP